MNNNTIGTYIWLGVMAVLVLALRSADGGIGSAIEQIDTLFLAATTSVPSIGTGAYLPMLVIGGLLALAWAMFRTDGSDGGAKSLTARKHLAIQYRLLAKDLDND